jgi:hypothetical protein
MKGAAQRGFVAVLTGLAVFVLTAAECGAQPPSEAAKAAEAAKSDVSDADRMFRNFTRESATVDHNQIRVEVRALRTEEISEGGDPDCKGPNRSNCARLNTVGQRVLGVEDVDGSIIDLVASYGVFQNAEVGAILPFVIETVKRDDGSKNTNEDIGDVLFYGKYKQAVAEHCTVSGGLELTAPTGDETETRTMPARFRVNGSNAGRGYSAFGAGDVGLNPFASTRYQMGRFGVGAHVGYNFYTGDKTPEVFNWSVQAVVRATELFSFRTELSGRLFDQFGTTWNDIVMMPGIDFNLSENFVIRPEGLANITGTAQDWGVGLGIAGVF